MIVVLNSTLEDDVLMLCIKTLFSLRMGLLLTINLLFTIIFYQFRWCLKIFFVSF